MTVELTYLTLVTTFTAVMWIPYILNMIMVRGLVDAVGYPDNPKPMALWATRMKEAHYNAVENLVVFGALVLIAHTVGIHNNAIILACTIYFWARVVHFFTHSFGFPWIRTASFFVGVGCQLTIAWQILM